jgi:1-aminocyclopropane-1-carboxylate deaminase/D-cysteine desulfhydrase-like pyridoxal-dependent ACC family enzyme
MQRINHARVQILREKIAQFDRVKLANLPTPLVELHNFSAALRGPKIYMKRDDLTGGVAFGGNKTRMLEFRLAPAVKQKADVIISGFGIQSNHARQIVVAARKLGIDVRLILRKIRQDEEVHVQGNLLIDLLAGAYVKIVDATSEEQATLIHNEINRLRAEGRKPYETGYDDEDLSAVSYVACSLELLDQIEALAIEPTHLYVASEGATQAGLTLFSKYAETEYQVVGINMVDWVPDIPARISSIANAAAKRLAIECYVAPSDVANDGSYVGPGYAEPTPECIRAIKLLAETEGILADPVYVGKGLAGLIDHIETRKLGESDTVIYLHTGGVPALFCYTDVFGFQELVEVSDKGTVSES